MIKDHILIGTLKMVQIPFGCSQRGGIRTKKLIGQTVGGF